jgi:hypothetical protein
MLEMVTESFNLENRSNGQTCCREEWTGAQDLSLVFSGFLHVRFKIKRAKSSLPETAVVSDVIAGGGVTRYRNGQAGTGN